ncbi:hypothetical protein [Gottfriedia acidiceleris]|uniref:hypothetical protein n=1 Tax=Gottfriedia acidiceleris TaxID=371036 RepID=UPI003D19EE2A
MKLLLTILIPCISIFLFTMYVIFADSTTSKTRINVSEISTKLKTNNQTLLIPTGYNSSVVYLHDNGFTSPNVEVRLSKDIKIYIYTSNDLEIKDSSIPIKTKKINNTIIKEYQSPGKIIDYVFRVNKLIYLYSFNEPLQKEIDEYLIKNLLIDSCTK